MDVIEAQRLVLEHLLEGRPLPGRARALSLDTLVPAEASREIMLVDHRDSAKLRFPTGVRIVSSTSEELVDARQATVLEFLKAETPAEGVAIRLRVATADPQHGLVPHGEIIATLSGEPPRAIDPTHVVAY